MKDCQFVAHKRYITISYIERKEPRLTKTNSSPSFLSKRVVSRSRIHLIRWVTILIKKKVAVVRASLLTFHANRLFYSYNLLFLAVTYLIPMTVMCVCYALMGRELCGSRSIGEVTHNQRESMKSKRKVRYRPLSGCCRLDKISRRLRKNACDKREQDTSECLEHTVVNSCVLSHYIEQFLEKPKARRQNFEK